MNKPNWKKFNVNTSSKRKRKQIVNKKKRTKPLKTRGLKMPIGKLETSKRNQLKKPNKDKMKQPEVQNPNLIPTKAPNKKTLASWTTPPNTTSQVSFHRHL